MAEGKMKKYKRRPLTYTEHDYEQVKERIENTGLVFKDKLEAGIYEIVSRYQGDNSLSQSQVDYLVAAIMKFPEENYACMEKTPELLGLARYLNGIPDLPGQAPRE